MALLRRNNKSVVAVVGDGSWATAIMKILNDHDLKMRWWIRKKDRARYIKVYGYNPNYLQGVHLTKSKVRPSSKLTRVIADAETVILAVPAAFIKNALKELPLNAFEGKNVVSAIKGMLPDDHKLVTDLLIDRFNVPKDKIAIIAGPCHAEEVAMERQSYLTIGGFKEETCEQVASLLRCRYLNVSVNTDLFGVEYAAVMKNIVALACGIAHGLNLGDNFQAVLVSNAMQEIARFLDKIAPQERDLFQSVYVGDLLVTAYSQFSRNRMFGNMIGQGYTVKSAQLEMNMIAEGYYAVKSINHLLAEKQITNMPITEAVNNILYKGKNPFQEFQLLKNKLS